LVDCLGDALGFGFGVAVADADFELADSIGLAGDVGGDAIELRINVS
jgi:hypothetical protein